MHYKGKHTSSKLQKYPYYFHLKMSLLLVMNISFFSLLFFYDIRFYSISLFLFPSTLIFMFCEKDKSFVLEMQFMSVYYKMLQWRRIKELFVNPQDITNSRDISSIINSNTNSINSNINSSCNIIVYINSINSSITASAPTNTAPTSRDMNCEKQTSLNSWHLKLSWKKSKPKLSGEDISRILWAFPKPLCMFLSPAMFNTTFNKGFLNCFQECSWGKCLPKCLPK